MEKYTYCQCLYYEHKKNEKLPAVIVKEELFNYIKISQRSNMGGKCIICRAQKPGENCRLVTTPYRVPDFYSQGIYCSKMLNPLDMNFYGQQNHGSLAYAEEMSVPNETIFYSNQQRQSYVFNSNIMGNQVPNNARGRKRGGIGKWAKRSKGRRFKIDPYPSPSFRNYPFTERGLPKALQELFTPMKCNLCNCMMGSASTTKDHYSGKKHRLNMKKWFLVHPEYQGQASGNYFGPQTKIMDPSKLYCKYCDVVLSSEQQVESHYMGRKHQNIINRGVPKNAFFNPIQQQWERFQKNSIEARNSLGFGFLEKQVIGKEWSPAQKCFCEICMVACPSEITFKEHMAGARHRKRMALLTQPETPPAIKDKNVEEGPKMGANAPGTSDLSIYRTPTGKFYCSTCNVTVNSPTQFFQHSESKKHKSRAALPVAQPPTKE